MPNTLHTVTELGAFNRAAKAAGMSALDVEDLVTYLAENPDAGDEIQGTGGCRKLRFSIRGNTKGKSGGVRTITLFSGPDLPVFLITVFAKNQKVTLTKAERNSLKKLSDQIVREYARRVSPLAEGDRE
ncbi:MAG: type II toxin-antitoxin system RelE/ParE family toxin [Hoeflea sp.]|uniref:type II toxin-antitoxin system RelE/ParE family toxin n=1 Tax=Hoeflea sp. TaxID=1940281 RepID=UPI001D5F1F92|nr:type II toxin-antitoxin system RelE/ParE family toxin [Hoeflea sp.]MBU4530160.1 type II toxin-antitoxin system RelE/ParE family toxin [Alphaproteobacteria bacterium]MBU4542555.1 type II toxin-antitoxin system RelE/ParE family toxin [Alphaproteobacteria bacterium]MBU4551236.1 type II toxin-antitoxin system RelE/ParE family toxin [Alphaproteobacteria bacterium]MBV1723059.1 type II toxin-antitoxin system RelE/ParE family toxin [Hoeflea sp.]MBV1760070.1 type II toxin-antitoxin system RelE/ParE 